MSDTAVIERAPVWKRVVASILDFFTVFFVFGWIIGHYTGNTTDEGFKLNGSGDFVVCCADCVFFHRAPLCGRHALGLDFPHRPAATQVRA
jgi:hypothetical protein